VKTTERDMCTATAIVIRDAVCPVRGGDVHLDDHKIRLIVQRQALDVLVLDLDHIVVAQISGQCGKAQRWK
jgi:hypothetical protein